MPAWTTTSGARLSFPAVHLSFREQQVLDAIYRDGLSDEAAAFELFLSRGRIANVLFDVRSKFKAAGRPLPPRTHKGT